MTVFGFEPGTTRVPTEIFPLLLLVVVVVVSFAGCDDGSCCRSAEADISDRAMRSAVVIGPSDSSRDADVASHVVDGFDACFSSETKTTWAVSETFIWRAGLRKTALADDPATNKMGAANAACARQREVRSWLDLILDVWISRFRVREPARQGEKSGLNEYLKDWGGGKD